MQEIMPTDLYPGELNVMDLYRRLSSISKRLPDYDPLKKGYDMCLRLLGLALRKHWSVNYILQEKLLNARIRKLELKVDDLKEDNKVLLNKLNQYESKN